MKLYDLVQFLIIFVGVAASALYMFGRIAPQWRKQCARHLQQSHYPGWVNRIGVRMSGEGGCGSCDSCGACATPTSPDKK